MRRLILLLLLAPLLVWADVNKKDGTTISTASTLDGETGLAKADGQTIASSGGAVTVTQSSSPASNGGGDATLEVSFGSLPAAGSTVVMAFSMYGTSGFGTTCTDNQGNGAYTRAEIATESGNGDTAEIWYKANIGSPSGTFTVTCTATVSVYAWGVLLELDGVNNSNPIRDTGTNTGHATSTDASVTSAGSSAAVGDLAVVTVVVKISSSNVNLGANATTGYTNVSLQQNYSAITSQSADYKEIGSAGSQSANWSHDAATPDPYGWACVMAIFEAA